MRWRCIAKFCQNLVGPGADDAGLQGNFLMVGGKAVLFPVFAGYDEYGVTDGLSGKAGSCRSESYGQVVVAG